MSVFFDGHEDSRDIERRSRGGAEGVLLPSFLKTPETPQRDGVGGERTMRGAVYERLEGVVHLALALTIVAGSALILGTALFGPGAPLGGTTESHVELAAAPETILPAVLPDPNIAAANEPDDVNLQASRVDPFLGGKPMTETAAKLVMPVSAPEPLAPPSAEMREQMSAIRSASQAEPAPLAKDAPAAPAPPTGTEMKREAAADIEKPAETADSSHMSRCYVKLGGRVQMSGSCRVRRDAESVTFDLPGKNLSLSHAHGKTWTATLGGREVGKVYRRGACWGAKHLYVCDNG